METFSDITLVTRVAVFHDKRAFDRLVRKYQSPVRRFFMSQTLGDVQLSDDLAQDTFIKAYTNIGTFRGKAAFRTWLFRIACNVFYDYVRSRWTTDDIDTADASRQNSYTPSGTLRMDIYDALARLKPVERTCITLQLIDGQPIERIAEITDMPTNTVKSHLSRDKSKLAEFLKRNGYE